MVPVIALQTFWRTSGTYLWNKFRSNGAFCAYYEPLNEVLLNKPSSVLRQQFENGIVAKLGHPSLSAHYFAEYPIEADGGVKYFLQRFSYDRYAMAEDDEDQELHGYFDYLITDASRTGRRPVFKFCRMGLRQRWFARNFPASTVVVVRDFNDTFRSYLSMAEKSMDFLKIMFRIIIKNRHEPLFAAIAHHVGAAVPHAMTELEIRNKANQLYATATRSILCDMSFFFWATYIFEGLTLADEVFDVDVIGSDAHERARITESFSQRFEAQFDFSDLNLRTGAARETISPAAIGIIRDAIGSRFGAVQPLAISALSVPTQDLLFALM